MIFLPVELAPGGLGDHPIVVLAGGLQPLRERRLQHRAAAATVNVSALLTMEPEVVVAQTLPQFPAVEYDETMQFSSKTPIEPLLKAAAQQSDLLADITVADLYGASDGEYSVTLRFTYRKNDRTLQEQEVRTEHAKVLAALAK